AIRDEDQDDRPDHSRQGVGQGTRIRDEPLAWREGGEDLSVQPELKSDVLEWLLPPGHLRREERQQIVEELVRRFERRVGAEHDVRVALITVQAGETAQEERAHVPLGA